MASGFWIKICSYPLFRYQLASTEGHKSQLCVVSETWHFIEKLPHEILCLSLWRVFHEKEKDMHGFPWGAPQKPRESWESSGWLSILCVLVSLSLRWTFHKILKWTWVKLLRCFSIFTIIWPFHHILPLKNTRSICPITWKLLETTVLP